MGLRLNGCCCMKLRTAGLLYGWLSIVCLVVLIGVTAFRIHRFETLNTDYMRKIVIDVEDRYPYDIFGWFSISKFENAEIITLVNYIFDLLFSVLLITGIGRKKQNMLLPWLVYKFIILIIFIQSAVNVLRLSSVSNESIVAWRALFIAFIMGIFLWIWIVIYSLYEEIREKRKRAIKRKMQAPRQEPLPYIESGSIYPLPAYRTYDR